MGSMALMMHVPISPTPFLKPGSERYAKCYSHMQARDPLTILWAATQMF